MNSQSSNNQSVVGGIVGLALIGGLTIALLSQIQKAPWPAVAALCALLTAIVTVYRDIHLQIRTEQKEKKVEVYEQLIGFFFSLLFAVHLKKQPPNESEINEFLIQVTPQLILWGSDDVLLSFQRFREMGSNVKAEGDPLTLMNNFEEMLLKIRKDLGHSNQSLTQGSILKIFINDWSQFSEANQNNNSRKLVEARDIN
jgi:hypothetical protein